VPKALEAVCLKAMALRPEDRYSSALALAADVELWLADEPVPAYREPMTTRLGRWVRRYKVLVAGAAVTLVVLTVSYLVVQRVEAASRFHVAAMQIKANAIGLGQLTIRHDELETSVRATMDRISARIAHDSRLDGPELQPLRGDLLAETLAFWDGAIAFETKPGRAPGGRLGLYRRQRAICLARLGDHSRAASEAEIVGADTKEWDRSAAAAYDLARVYALCAAAARNDPAQSNEYAESALEFLEKAARAGYFERSAPAESPGKDPDFDSLQPREDFHQWLRESEAKSR
jgi:hypothetical protein